MTNRMPTPPEARKVIVGVDTHKHVHVAVAIDSWGIRLRDQAFVADSGGYQAHSIRRARGWWHMWRRRLPGRRRRPGPSRATRRPGARPAAWGPAYEPP